jgi:cell division septum initiation protein DivIVA
MALRRRGKGGESGTPRSYSNLGTRIADLLRLAEEQRDQIITEAHQEAARIVDEARNEADEILAKARLRAVQLPDDAMVQPTPEPAPTAGSGHGT